MALTAYLAGPDVFLPDARAHAARKCLICSQAGFIGLAPLDDESAIPDWQKIFRADVAMMEASDIIIANLTPFRGASADAGTLVELGWFLGRNKPIYGYSNSAAPFDQRSRAQCAAIADPLAGLIHESFGLTDNLMIAGAVWQSGHPVFTPTDGQDRAFNALDIFERCVRYAADQHR